MVERKGKEEEKQSYLQFIDHNVRNPEFVSGKGNFGCAALVWVPTDKLIGPPLK